MSDKPHRHRRGRRLLAWSTATALSAGLILASGVPPTSYAADNEAIQSVAVQVGRNATINAIVSSAAVRDEQGRLVDSDPVELDPATTAEQLPVRLQTVWWQEDLPGQTDDESNQKNNSQDQRTGTDLSQLAGRSGRFIIELSVHNLTTAPQEVSFDSNGSRYRQYALVGVPLTVVATASLDTTEGAEIVTKSSSEDDRVTTGVPFATGEREQQVSWTTWLAPPLLPPTATFRLVVDATDFVLPQFNVIIQPGLVTELSVSSVLNNSLGTSGSAGQLELAALQMVTTVNQQITEAQEYVEQVYEDISGDARLLGSQTYAELQASSQLILSHIEATQSQLDQLQQQTSSQLSSAAGSVRSDLSAVFSHLSRNVLGSPNSRPEFVDGAISGCELELPTLSDDAPRTLSTTVQLVEQQLATIVDLFDDQNELTPPYTSNCRTAMLEQLSVSLGSQDQFEDPDEYCTTDDPSVICTLNQSLSTVVSQREDLTNTIAELKTPTLLEKVDALLDDLDALNTLAAAATSKLESRESTLESDVNTAKQAVDQAAQALANQILAKANDISSKVNEIRLARDQASSNLAAARTGLEQMINNELLPRLTDIEAEANRALSLPFPADTSINQLTLPAFGQWFSGTSQLETIDRVIAADPACVNDPPNWSQTLGLSNESTKEQIVAALASNLSQGCAAAPAVANSIAAARALVNGYDLLQVGLNSANRDVDRANLVLGDYLNLANGQKTALNNINTMADNAVNDLPATIQSQVTENLTRAEQALNDLSTALNETDQAIGSLINRLNQLTVAGKDDELLSGVTTAINTLNENSTSALLSVKTDVGGISNRLAETHTTDSVPLLPDDLLAQSTDDIILYCTDYRSDDAPNSPPTPTVDAIIWLTNRAACLQDQLTEDLKAWEIDVTAAYGTAIDQTNATRDQLSNSVTQLSDIVVQRLRDETLTVTDENLAQITTTQTNLDRDLTTVVDSFSASTSQVVTDLAAQIAQTHADAAEVEAALTADFDRIMTDLGSPEETSRTGLLGKLRSITSQVGDTSEVLVQVNQLTEAYSRVQDNEFRALDLAAAQLKAAENQLDRFGSFPGLPDNVDAQPVFIYHVES